jgi:hypothetical protein
MKSLSCSYFLLCSRVGWLFLCNICVLHLTLLSKNPVSFVRLLTVCKWSSQLRSDCIAHCGWIYCFY